jgi:hypothetical protein
VNDLFNVVDRLPEHERLEVCRLDYELERA